jgi:hypothetical protein
MDAYILKKAKGVDKMQKTHYPVCPSCDNADYNKLTFCTLCEKLVCDSCLSTHDKQK